MMIFLWSLFCEAIPLARCGDLVSLHESPSPLSKIYSPQLYALRKIPWNDLEQAGLNPDSTLEIGSNWVYWSSVSDIGFGLFIQPYLWPNAQMADLGDSFVLETNDGRWIGKKEGNGLRIAHISAQKESFPKFWGNIEAGCQVHMTSVQLPYFQARPDEGVQLSFLHDDEKVWIRFPRKGELPNNFEKKPLGKWNSLTSNTRPTLSLALGEEPLSLIESSLFSIPESISEQEIKKIDKKLHIGSGTQVALFQDDVLLSIPLLGWFGCPLPRWQIKWGLRKGEKIGKHRRKLVQAGETWFVEAQKGRVIMATSAELLDIGISDEGDAWFSSPQKHSETHVLARVNIPSSMYMFVGPLDYVELSLLAQEENWEIIFSAGTQSKAKPHQLFLTYFATLQKWTLQQQKNIPEDLATILKKAALQSTVSENGKELISNEPLRHSVWKEQELWFLEDLEGEIWVYHPKLGIDKCGNDMTTACEKVK